MDNERQAELVRSSYSEAIAGIRAAENCLRQAFGVPDLPKLVIELDGHLPCVIGDKAVRVTKLVLSVGLDQGVPFLELQASDFEVSPASDGA